MALTGPERDASRRLAALLLAHPWRRDVLQALRDQAPDAWIVGGFVRNSVWDDVANAATPTPLDDVDVVVFEPGACADDVEDDLTARLARELPEIPWSVRNQARMHRRSGDEPYDSLATAIQFYPDTASAVAVRLRADGTLEILAPYGLADAFAGVVRPTPAARSRTPDRYAERVARKGPEWQRRWPWLRVEAPRG